MSDPRIIESPFFFRTADRPLYGMLYTPAEGLSTRGLVICDSLFEEKFWCERVFANLGRRLAAEGITVLSFDYHGYGSSTGNSEDVTARGMEDDIGAACDLLRNRGVGSVALLGIRWGAVPAARIAGKRNDVNGLFLVNPISDWKKQLMAALRGNVAGQYAIFKKPVMTREQIVDDLMAGGDCVRAGYRMNNVDGYILSREFFAEAGRLEMPMGLGHKVTVITIPEKHTGGPVREDPLAKALAEAGTDTEWLAITEDNAFWINNRIFTSDAPRFFDEMTARIKALPESGAADDPGEIEVSRSIDNGGIVEEIAEITSFDGHPLCGIVYRPREGSREEGFVFTHGGLIGLNGAFRFNTRAARRLAAAGYPSICADTHGMGRSGGHIDNQEQRVLFREICAGLFAGDVAAAARYLREATGVGKTAAFGVCGGAITNILSQSRYDDIDESVLLSIPVMLPGLDYGKVRMSEGYAKFYLGMYVRKIFNPKAWWRFLTGKSETDKIMKSVRVAAGGVLKKAGAKKAGQKPEPAACQKPKSGLSVAVPGAGDDLQFNDAFLEAYRTVIGRKQRIYFVFGEHDNFKWEFNSEFVEGMPEEFAAGAECIRIDEITHANHMYTLREWQDEIIDRCVEWTAR